VIDGIEGAMMFEVIWVSSGFVHGRWVGGNGQMLKAHQCLRMVGISQHCLKGVMGHYSYIPYHPMTFADQLWLVPSYHTATHHIHTNSGPHLNSDLLKSQPCSSFIV